MAGRSLLRTSSSLFRSSRMTNSRGFLLRSSIGSQSRFFGIYKFASKDSIKNTDEMNRGYFADISELRKHGGKMAMANKTIVPSMVAKKFPLIEVEFSDGRRRGIPIVFESGVECPGASLLCLSFQASSQAMIESWCVPFRSAFSSSKDIHIYEVSFIDSWILSLNPIKRLLLRVMRKSSNIEGDKALHRYIFLVDKFGKIRWQGFGLATKEEVSSLLPCTYSVVGREMR